MMCECVCVSFELLRHFFRKEGTSTRSHQLQEHERKKILKRRKEVRRAEKRKRTKREGEMSCVCGVFSCKSCVFPCCCWLLLLRFLGGSVSLSMYVCVCVCVRCSLSGCGLQSKGRSRAQAARIWRKGAHTTRGGVLGS